MHLFWATKVVVSNYSVIIGALDFFPRIASYVNFYASNRVMHIPPVSFEQHL